MNDVIITGWVFLLAMPLFARGIVLGRLVMLPLREEVNKDRHNKYVLVGQVLSMFSALVGCFGGYFIINIPLQFILAFFLIFLLLLPVSTWRLLQKFDHSNRDSTT